MSYRPHLWQGLDDHHVVQLRVFRTYAVEPSFKLNTVRDAKDRPNLLPRSEALGHRNDQQIYRPMKANSMWIYSLLNINKLPMVSVGIARVPLSSSVGRSEGAKLHKSIHA